MPKTTAISSLWNKLDVSDAAGSNEYSLMNSLVSEFFSAKRSLSGGGSLNSEIEFSEVYGGPFRCSESIALVWAGPTT